jgi:hypothetical protein
MNDASEPEEARKLDEKAFIEHTKNKVVSYQSRRNVAKLCKVIRTHTKTSKRYKSIANRTLFSSRMSTPC